MAFPRPYGSGRVSL